MPNAFGPGCKSVPPTKFYNLSTGYSNQRWSPRGRPWPRGHILKSLALASKVKSLALASRPQVLENWPVLGSRTALFFGMLKFCGALEKFFGKRFLVEIAWKNIEKTFFFIFLRSPKKFLWRPFFFFWIALALVSLVLCLGLEHSCPWPRECLSLERLSLALASDFFCVLGLGLEPCVLDSTSGSNIIKSYNSKKLTSINLIRVHFIRKNHLGQGPNGTRFERRDW